MKAVRKCRVIDLGIMDYRQAYRIQKAVAREKFSGSREDTLILVEHPPVITLGRRGGREHVLLDDKELRDKGIEVIEVDRGGDVTYHGYGQLVGYPIIDLRRHRCDIHWMLRQLEEVILRVLTDYGIEAQRIPDYTGVWIGDRKVAAIGIGISHWVTYHGFALNVVEDRDYENLVTPCGIVGKGVISLEEALGRVTERVEVVPVLLRHFAETFGLEVICP